jgi:hypothetical protein
LAGINCRVPIFIASNEVTWSIAKVEEKEVD